MRNIKRLMIFLICLIIITIITIIIMLNLSKKQLMTEEYVLPPSDIQEDVKDTVYYFTVRNCLNTYYTILNKNNNYYQRDKEGNEVPILSEMDKKQQVYDLLSKEYISKNNITVENVYDYVENINEMVVFIPLQMQVLDNETIGKYVVHGIIENTLTYKAIKEVYLIVTLDGQNKSFSVEPINNTVTNIEDVKLINNAEEIIPNDTNTYDIAKVKVTDLLKEYMEQYKKLAIGYPQKAYELLDQEYKEKRFGSISNYVKYIEKNVNQIKQARLTKYQQKEEDQYRQYTCIDQFGNYYIIRETAIMQYTLLLDDYTVDIPEYVQKYNSATLPQRVALNIQRFVRAVNDENYTYAYSFLSEGFKNNYFKEQDTFEAYAKNILLGKSNIEFGNVTNEGNIYTCEVTLTNPNNQEQTISKTFIVRLGDGTAFEMSFNQ